MAVYGNDFYGLVLYGANTLVDFDARPFTASSTNYREIFVEWTLPTGDWDTIRLVRNTFGFPMTPDDGDVLFEDNSSTNERSYLDRGQIPNNAGLLQGQVYYYSIFVRQTANFEWAKAGETLGVSVKRYGTPNLMYEYIPDVQKIANINSYVGNPEEINSDLIQFLQIFGFEYDLFKTTAENIKNRYDVLRLDGRLVPALLNQFGFSYEPEIGLQQARVLLRNAVKIHSERGSTSGLRSFVTAFTGYNCDILPPVNLMLSLDDSSFRQTIGFWENVSNTTLIRGTLDSETPAVAPYEEPNSPSNFPNSAVGFLKTTAQANGNMEIACGVSSILKRGIPVDAETTYTLTAYSQAKTTTRSITLDIKWYDINGVLLSTAGEQSYTNSVGTWTRSTAVSGEAPEEARFAVPYIRVNGAVLGEVHYFDAIQFEKGSAASSFTDARRIDVVLRANRINQVINPSFETDLNNWLAINGTLSQSAMGSSESSLNCATITATADSAAGMYSDTQVSVIPGDQHAVSGYVKGPVGTFASIDLLWTSSEIPEYSIVSSSTAVPLTGDWQRIEFEVLAPGDADGATIFFQFDGGVTGDEFHVDEVLFEKAAYVSPYFDGESGYAQRGDVLWESGFDNDSRSHYYKNRETITKRLISVLGDYIPSGSAWAVFVAQPD